MEISFTAKPINLSQAKHLKRQILKPKNLDIICHNNSDEDSFACAKALQWFRQSYGKNVRIITNNAEDIFQYDTKSLIDTSKETSKLADTVLCVDFSATNRITPETLEQIKSAKKVLCIDHHSGSNISSKNPKDIYIDTTAKSCSGIILRLFEKLNINPPKNILKQLFSGMTDDLRKNNYLKYNETLTPIQKEKMFQDVNTKHLYDKLTKKLTSKEQTEVVGHLNVLSRLTPAEKAFKDSLPSRLKYSADGKFGYIVIPVDDQEWKAIGGDNKITSTIMANFRTETIENNNGPLDIIAIFYPTNDLYQVSMHSKNNNVVNLVNKLKETDPNLSAGGHANRGGGRIYTLNSKKCQEWVDNFISKANEFFEGI